MNKHRAAAKIVFIKIPSNKGVKVSRYGYAHSSRFWLVGIGHSVFSWGFIASVLWEVGWISDSDSSRNLIGYLPC